MRGAANGSAGVTLVELMIATAVLTIAVAGLGVTFAGIQKAVQAAKNKTLASNLAQEKMSIISQQSYFRVIPTMSPAFLPDGTPYDTSAFPPESVLEGGVGFVRYTYVQVVSENSGVIGVLPPTTPDTGMRQVTVTVAWMERGQSRTLSINSVLANPNTVESNSVFEGTVKDAGSGAAIAGALVNVAENVGWRDSTDASGRYTIRLSPGSFNLLASARGYFPQFFFLGVGPNNTTTQDFTLTAMSSGSVVGAAWLEPGAVISQVVASTVQSNGFDVEYVELYNPTPNPYVLSAGGPISLNLVSGFNNLQCVNIQLNYVNTTLAAGGYYLIANTTTFTVDGASFTADAYYTDSANAGCNGVPAGWGPPASRDLMQRSHSNTLYLTDASGRVLDAVGWTNNGAVHNPSYCTGTCIPQPNNALPVGDQVVRTSSPAWASAGVARAYKSGSNAADFAYPGAAGALNIAGIPYPPLTTQSPAPPLIAGVPAVGAVVSADDGLSSPVQAAAVGSPPVAQFALTRVATGTWMVLITSGSYQLENDTVAVGGSGSVFVFPSSTTMLEGAATAGFIAGTVVDGYGTPISAPSPITLSAAGQTAVASAGTGRYLLRVSTGDIDVAANPGYANPDYVSVSSLAASVALGRISDGVNFVLTQGGRLSGWVTRDGVNGLQGVTVVATDVNGNAQDQEVTDVNGNFKTINVATGTYTLTVPLDTTETSNPSVLSATAQLGLTVFAGTFTVTGALGTIGGSVTLAGKPIATGVLIVISTGAVAAPPTISAAMLTSSAYYLGSSLENGTYSVSVRQSTAPAYNVYGYYTTISSSGAVAISQRQLAGVGVLAGQSVTGEDLTW